MDSSNGLHPHLVRYYDWCTGDIERDNRRCFMALQSGSIGKGNGLAVGRIGWSSNGIAGRYGCHVINSAYVPLGRDRG